MTATIKIVVDRRDDVLRAPDQALRYSPAGHAAPSDSSGARTPLAGWPQVSEPCAREGRQRSQFNLVSRTASTRELSKAT